MTGDRSSRSGGTAATLLQRYDNSTGMEQNVGSTDALMRVLLGAVLGVASLAILGDYVEAAAILSPVLGLVSAVLLATGLTNTCGLYSALGLDTR